MRRMTNHKAPSSSVAWRTRSTAFDRRTKAQLVQQNDLLELSVSALVRDNRRLRRLARNRLIKINLLK